MDIIILPVASTNIVSARDTQYVVECICLVHVLGTLSNDKYQLALIVDVLGGKLDRRLVAYQARWNLEESLGILGGHPLAQMTTVVQCKGNNLGRRRRHQEGDLVEWMRNVGLFPELEKIAGQLPNTFSFYNSIHHSIGDFKSHVFCHCPAHFLGLQRRANACCAKAEKDHGYSHSQSVHDVLPPNVWTKCCHFIEFMRSFLALTGTSEAYVVLFWASMLTTYTLTTIIQRKSDCWFGAKGKKGKTPCLK